MSRETGTKSKDLFSYVIKKLVGCCLIFVCLFIIYLSIYLSIHNEKLAIVGEPTNLRHKQPDFDEATEKMYVICWGEKRRGDSPGSSRDAGGGEGPRSALSMHLPGTCEPCNCYQSLVLARSV